MGSTWEAHGKHMGSTWAGAWLNSIKIIKFKGVPRSKPAGGRGLGRTLRSSGSIEGHSNGGPGRNCEQDCYSLPQMEEEGIRPQFDM